MQKTLLDVVEADYKVFAVLNGGLFREIEDRVTDANLRQRAIIYALQDATRTSIGLLEIRFHYGCVTGCFFFNVDYGSHDWILLF